jgi:hypothetical protein
MRTPAGFRPFVLLVRACLAALALPGLACGEREAPPPPVEAMPAVPPPAAESAGAPDTLVGDSVMARDTIPPP